METTIHYKKSDRVFSFYFAFTGIIGICVEKKDNRIRADSGMETERMAEENTAASGKIKEEEVKKVALTFDDGPNRIIRRHFWKV